MWVLALGACVARTPPRPMALADGDRLARPGPVRIALVGDLAEAGPDVLADLRAQEPAFVVLAGDAVRRGTRGAWAELHERLDGLPAVPVPGRGERRGDRRLARFAGAWEGLGVRGLSDPLPWRAFDVATGDATWRVLVVDADREALGRRWADELFWIPKAVAADDGPLLVLANQPVRSLAAGWHPAEAAGMEQILELVRRHADPTRVVLVAAAGATPPELLLPGGAWGEGWLGVGRVGGEPEALARATEGHALAPELDAALSEWFSTGGVAPNVGEAWDAERFPVLGWWLLELEGHSLAVTLRMSDGEAWRPAFTGRWSPETGWAPPDRAGEDAGRHGDRAGEDAGRHGDRAGEDAGHHGDRAGEDAGHHGDRAGEDAGRHRIGPAATDCLSPGRGAAVVSGVPPDGS